MMDRSGVWIRAHSCSKQAPGLQPPLSHPGVCRYVRTYIRMLCVYICTVAVVFWAYVVLHDLGFELVKHCGWPLGLWATGEPARVPPWSMYFVLKRIIDYRYRFILLASVF